MVGCAFGLPRWLAFLWFCYGIDFSVSVCSGIVWLWVVLDFGRSAGLLVLFA